MRATVFAALLLGPLAVQTQAQEAFSPYVDENGTIAFPAKFRTSLAHLGSWFVPAGDASGFHDVYTEPESIAFYRREGRFPDGATLVKELRSSTADDYTTGSDISHSTSTVKQWFVMIRDDTGRFPDNARWGDGWGWALFKPGATESNASADYRTDCRGCHVPARDTDWVYVEAYPVLGTNGD